MQEDPDERQEMRQFWERHSREASLQEMMLDHDAASLHSQEFPEILSHLPSYQDKTVVELGAGIGRFTSIFAAKAKRVVALDFIDRFIEKNKENNRQFSNIDYLCADATKVSFEEQSVDLIFTNWLMMYLTDAEFRLLVTKQLSWLQEGGFIFVRESCFHPSGNAVRDENPTHYRDPGFYSAVFTSARHSTATGETFGLKIVEASSLQSYLKSVKQFGSGRDTDDRGLFWIQTVYTLDHDFALGAESVKGSQRKP